MLNSFAEYCNAWSLTINTSKTKIMIFQKHQRRYKRTEKWLLNGAVLENVKEFKYLGLTFTYNMSFRKHLFEKLNQAKMAINSTWKNVFGNAVIPLSAKYKVFEATAKSIMYYAAQVWGLEAYDEVEKLLRYYLKRTFKLPSNTPNYMLHLETGLPALYVSTLHLHFDYVQKIIAMPDHRLPKIICLKQLARRKGCFETWLSLAEKFGVPLNLENSGSWQSWQQELLRAIDLNHREKMITKARESEVRRVYVRLNYNLNEQNYFNDLYTANEIRNLFKVRGELLRLNYRPHFDNSESFCPICNLRVEENIFHFVGECPILREFRMAYFGLPFLQRDETVG